MDELRQIDPGNVESDAELGRKAARLIWNDAPEVEDIHDPRSPEFAGVVIDELSSQLAHSPGVVKRMMNGAAAAAEDLNVGRFQGLVEVIQNADDVTATEVRFALRGQKERRQLLIVHNGQPVTCHHVLGMALPFLTTKTNRVDQRGRFGIGLKTLKRIARSIAIHSAPYHFCGDQLSLSVVSPEPALSGLYDPSEETLLVLELRDDFDEAALRSWFDAWDDDGLLFQSSVSRFRWCTESGEPIVEKGLAFEPWEPDQPEQLHPGVRAVKRRTVRGGSNNWTVWKATLTVPKHLHPAHKTRSETTDISIAVPDRPMRSVLYIGFKTRVPFGLTFSLDAQFDPSTAREELIENPWNNWLIDRSGTVVADIAAGLLLSRPRDAWTLVPLSDEHVGNESDNWVRGRFASAFEKLRQHLAHKAQLAVGTERVALAGLAYEDSTLKGFLEVTDIERLSSGCRTIPVESRDKKERWRDVLDLLGVSTVLGTGQLLNGFDAGIFADKSPTWWTEAASRLVKHHDNDGLFGRRFWLGDDGTPLICRRLGDTDRPLVLGVSYSAFAARWSLLEQLHEVYRTGKPGQEAVAWLEEHVAFTSHVDAAVELRAFAERFAEKPIEIGDADLRDLRDRFDEIDDDQAKGLGRKVGAMLLLDGFVFKAGKRQELKVSPSAAYLPRTLDSENPDWPTAAGTLPGIVWISARYGEQLRTGAARRTRRRADGTISRGPRKFLMLLGAEIAPRLVRLEGPIQWGGADRIRELRAINAEQVAYDYTSHDLDRVLKDLARTSRKDAKVRSPALVRALSRSWERLYAGCARVPAEHVARVYTYSRGEVAAAWINMLREREWVVVGRSQLVEPSRAVIKTAETQTLYGTFAVGVEPSDVSDGLAAALRMIVDVRISDLVTHLKELRDAEEPADEAHVAQVYRTIARRCPAHATWNARVGDLTVQELRMRFSEGRGLIYVGGDTWRRPDELFRGRDIFHDRQRFAPGGSALEGLWSALAVREPGLSDCITFCRTLPREGYDPTTDAILMDVYRHMEALLSSAERRHKDRLRALPLLCGEQWTVERPIYFVEDPELRDALAVSFPKRRFWNTPCDTSDLPRLVTMVGITRFAPELTVKEDQQQAAEQGEALRLQYQNAVDHLANELARNDPATRGRISIGWDALKTLPLFVYNQPFAVRARDTSLSSSGIDISLSALMIGAVELHVCEDALGDREQGGRAIAALFPPALRRKIDGEWALAWQKSLLSTPETIRLASDEQVKEALEAQATKINTSAKAKIKVTPPASRASTAEPRTLKESVGSVVGATVNTGGSPKTASPSSGASLSPNPPAPSASSGGGGPAVPVAYTNADLEQRGWEILVQALNTSPDKALIDFRKRHGVGADGAIDWKTFVEMKATGRGLQSSVELTAAEYERAVERGKGFILALVYGLETGWKDEVRLIFDPVRCVAVKPKSSVRLEGLANAPAVVIHFDDSEEQEQDNS